MKWLLIGGGLAMVVWLAILKSRDKTEKPATMSQAYSRPDSSQIKVNSLLSVGVEILHPSAKKFNVDKTTGLQQGGAALLHIPGIDPNRFGIGDQFIFELEGHRKLAPGSKFTIATVDRGGMAIVYEAHTNPGPIEPGSPVTMSFMSTKSSKEPLIGFAFAVMATAIDSDGSVSQEPLDVAKITYIPAAGPAESSGMTKLSMVPSGKIGEKTRIFNVEDGRFVKAGPIQSLEGYFPSNVGRPLGPADTLIFEFTGPFPNVTTLSLLIYASTPDGREEQMGFLAHVPAGEKSFSAPGPHAVRTNKSTRFDEAGAPTHFEMDVMSAPVEGKPVILKVVTFTKPSGTRKAATASPSGSRRAENSSELGVQSLEKLSLWMGDNPAGAFGEAHRSREARRNRKLILRPFTVKVGETEVTLTSIVGSDTPGEKSVKLQVVIGDFIATGIPPVALSLDDDLTVARWSGGPEGLSGRLDANGHPIDLDAFKTILNGWVGQDFNTLGTRRAAKKIHPLDRMMPVNNSKPMDLAWVLTTFEILEGRRSDLEDLPGSTLQPDRFRRDLKKADEDLVRLSASISEWKSTRGAKESDRLRRLIAAVDQELSFLEERMRAARQAPKVLEETADLVLRGLYEQKLKGNWALSDKILNSNTGMFGLHHLRKEVRKAAESEIDRENHEMFVRLIELYLSPRKLANLIAKIPGGRKEKAWKPSSGLDLFAARSLLESFPADQASYAAGRVPHDHETIRLTSNSFPVVTLGVTKNVDLLSDGWEEATVAISDENTAVQVRVHPRLPLNLTAKESALFIRRHLTSYYAFYFSRFGTLAGEMKAAGQIISVYPIITILEESGMSFDTGGAKQSVEGSLRRITIHWNARVVSKEARARRSELVRDLLDQNFRDAIGLEKFSVLKVSRDERFLTLADGLSDSQETFANLKTAAERRNGAQGSRRAAEKAVLKAGAQRKTLVPIQTIIKMREKAQHKTITLPVLRVDPPIGRKGGRTAALVVSPVEVVESSVAGSGRFEPRDVSAGNLLASRNRVRVPMDGSLTRQFGKLLLFGVASAEAAQMTAPVNLGNKRGDTTVLVTKRDGTLILSEEFAATPLGQVKVFNEGPMTKADLQKLLESRPGEKFFVENPRRVVSHETESSARHQVDASKANALDVRKTILSRDVLSAPAPSQVWFDAGRHFKGVKDLETFKTQFDLMAFELTQLHYYSSRDLQIVLQRLDSLDPRYQAHIQKVLGHFPVLADARTTPQDLSMLQLFLGEGTPSPDGFLHLGLAPASENSRIDWALQYALLKLTALRLFSAKTEEGKINPNDPAILQGLQDPRFAMIFGLTYEPTSFKQALLVLDLLAYHRYLLAPRPFNITSDAVLARIQQIVERDV